MLDVTRLLCRSDAVAARVQAGGGAGPGRRFAAAGPPVVVWNVTGRCHLHCRHCYAAARPAADPEELGPAEGLALVEDLGRARVPALIFSGGEPLLRPDLPDLVRAAAERGIHCAISTSGTVLDAPLARRLRQAGAGYLGVSVDGIGELHDRFRGLRGAYARALDGLRRAREAGLRVGLRFTLSRPTLPHLGPVLDLMEAEEVDRGYVSHLVYVGRAGRMASAALPPARTRAAVERIFARAEALHRRGARLELVTGNSDCDGVLLLLRVRAARPAAAAAVAALLRRRGGNSAGRTVASVDARGQVHPDQFWPHVSLGSVRQRPFADIWTDPAEPLLARLRDRGRWVGGRCARCAFLGLCGGGSRPRAEALTGDRWAADPACYLTDGEIGLAEEPDHARPRPADAGDPADLVPECAAPGAGR